MARTAVVHLPEGQEQAQASRFDELRAALFIAHLGIMAYVATGWMIPSRVALYVYTLLLPMIALQWLLNGGSSIINNVENLARTGRWNDPGNEFEGAFFKTLLQALGVRATQAQITTVLCFMMLIFWVAALCHMVLIVPMA
jgi:hypothetical protein